MFYTKLNPLMFQIEHSSNCCLGDRVWVNELLHSLYLLLRCFKSVLLQNVPHQAWCKLEFLSVWPWADLWRLYTPLTSIAPQGQGRCSSSATVVCFPLVVRLSSPHSWWLNVTVDGRGRSWGGPAEPTEFHPVSVGYSTENEDRLHLNDPHCLNVSVTLLHGNLLWRLPKFQSHALLGMWEY